MKVGQIQFRVWYSSSMDFFQLPIGSTFSTSRTSPAIRATIHQNAASWGRVVAGCHPLWGHCGVIPPFQRPTWHHPPPPDYSFLDRWVCARWRSEISIIQDTDQQRQQLGESEDASLKIWARKMKIEINEFKSKLDLHSKGSSPDLTYKNFVPVMLS